MTLKEALGSGRRIRRHGSPSWILPEMMRYWNAEDVMADDYEIEPEKVKKIMWIAVYGLKDNKSFATSNAYFTKEEAERMAPGKPIYQIEIEVEA